MNPLEKKGLVASEVATIIGTVFGSCGISGAVVTATVSETCTVKNSGVGSTAALCGSSAVVSVAGVFEVVVVLGDSVGVTAAVFGVVVVSGGSLLSAFFKSRGHIPLYLKPALMFSSLKATLSSLINLGNSSLVMALKDVFRACSRFIFNHSFLTGPKTATSSGWILSEKWSKYMYVI